MHPSLTKREKITATLQFVQFYRIISKYGFVSSNKIKCKIWSWLFSPKIIFYERKRHSLSDWISGSPLRLWDFETLNLALSSPLRLLAHIRDQLWDFELTFEALNSAFRLWVLYYNTNYSQRFIQICDNLFANIWQMLTNIWQIFMTNIRIISGSIKIWSIRSLHFLFLQF